MTETLDGSSNAYLMLSVPSHCHKALHLRCSKVPGSGSGICLLEKSMAILLSQHNAISALKMKYSFFN